jgi:two-component system response regulator CpxR
MKILVVDDEQKIANVLAERLKLRGFDATAVFDGTSALSLLRRETFDGIILDLRLPDIDGIEVLTETKGAFPDMKVVILSGHGNEQDFKTCLERGAIACFHKPAKISKLAEALTFPQVKRDESD